jgi:hypothetical protein
MGEKNNVGEHEKKVDEEWKQRARSEKEAASERRAESTTKGLPRPTFNMLISGIVTDALVSLGVVENPITGEQERNLKLAQYSIDLLQLLEEKTKGNLEDSEKHFLETALYDLRMKFVSAVSEQGSEKTQAGE